MGRGETPRGKSGCVSMTGFAAARAEFDGWAVGISVKSVNHRFLDVKLRMPEGFELYEGKLRQVVREKIQRGHVDVYLNIQPSGPTPLQINRDLARAYLAAAEELRKDSNSAAGVDLLALLRLPGVVTGVAPAVPESEEAQARLGAALRGCLSEAVGKLDEMRRTEGQHLAEDLRARSARIGEVTEQVRGLAAKLRPSFHRRLETRLKELLSDSGLEPGRIAQEAALLAERSDVCEELDRLRSHLTQFAQLLDGVGEAGKKLDFLLQEMHREANTLLSKTPGVESEGLAITGLALEIKAEIEKLREQVQNIE